MRFNAATALGLATVLLFVAGCAQNPRAAKQLELSLQRQQEQYAQLVELGQRSSDLDANNRDLHTQLAQSQQQAHVYADEVALLRKQLRETADQLASTSERERQTGDQLEAFQAATQRRGGATITANNRGESVLTAVTIPGIAVRLDGQEIRIELPSDQLFINATPTLQQSAFSLLDKTISAVTRQYPNEMITIEGHTDSGPLAGGQWRNHHHLSAAQSQVIFEQLISRYQLDPRRLRVSGHGANEPIVSNGSAQGRAQNRRIELVISPEGS